MSKYLTLLADYDARRKAAGISNMDLAVRCGVSEVTMSRWRNNKQMPTAEAWCKMVDTLEEMIAERAEKLARMAHK
jgi:transcriptional regulator with XRE-family HTH domain